MTDDELAPATDPTGAPAGHDDRGYSASKDQLQKRLARIEGQVRGISRMVEQDRYCVDVLTQINAVRAALDKVALGLLDGHARHCLLGTAPGRATRRSRCRSSWAPSGGCCPADLLDQRRVGRGSAPRRPRETRR
jgi:DNA-binding FrmR family transcriptional regulator